MCHAHKTLHCNTFHLPQLQSAVLKEEAQPQLVPQKKKSWTPETNSIIYKASLFRNASARAVPARGEDDYLADWCPLNIA